MKSGMRDPNATAMESGRRMGEAVAVMPSNPGSQSLVSCAESITVWSCRGWHIAFQHMRSLGLAINNTLKALSEKEGAQLSATTRRKLAARAVQQLNDAKEVLQDAGVEIQAMYRASISLKEKLATTESTRQELSQQLESSHKDVEVRIGTE